jgi:hypothetical protein
MIYDITWRRDAYVITGSNTPRLHRDVDMQSTVNTYSTPPEHEIREGAPPEDESIRTNSA